MNIINNKKLAIIVFFSQSDHSYSEEEEKKKNRKEVGEWHIPSVLNYKQETTNSHLLKK